MKNTRPKSISVFSVLNLIFGGIGLVWMLAGFMTMATHSPLRDQAIGLVLAFHANNILTVAACSLAIVSGASLMRAKTWARSVSIAFAATFFLNIILSFLLGVWMIRDGLTNDTRLEIGLLAAMYVAFAAYPAIFAAYLFTKKWNNYISRHTRIESNNSIDIAHPGPTA